MDALSATALAALLAGATVKLHNTLARRLRHRTVIGRAS